MGETGSFLCLDLRVATLRVSAPVFDTVSTQASLERTLDACAFGARVPKSAILCIRTFRDPKPRTLRLNAGGFDRNAAWREAAISSLETLKRSAARPARGLVPAS